MLSHDLLQQAVREGKAVELGQGLPMDQVGDRTADESLQVSADAIRAILCDRDLAKNADPRGLTIVSAIIVGRLDLAGLTTAIPLALVDCHLTAGINCMYIHISSLSLVGSRIDAGTSSPPQGRRGSGGLLARDTGAAFHGDGLYANHYLDMSCVHVAGGNGAVRLTEAHIDGPVSFRGADLSNATGSALYADGLQVAGSLYLDTEEPHQHQTGTEARRFTAEGAGDDDTVRLRGAHIGGQLTMSGAKLANPTGCALNANGLRVDEDMFLDEGFTADGDGDDGALWLVGAHIGGQLTMSGAKLANPTGPAMNANDLQTATDVHLHEGFTAEGDGAGGAVQLIDAHIGGHFVMSSAKLVNPTGPTLRADRVQVAGSVQFDDGFTAEGGGDGGAVQLSHARISGGLDLSGAKLSNPDGPALNADGLQIGDDAYLDEGFTAEGGGAAAAQLVDARISGKLAMSEAKLSNPAGPALWADRLQVGKDAYLDDGFTAEGSSILATVQLAGATIDRFHLSGAKLSNPDGPALNAAGMQIEDDAYLDDGFTAEGAGDGAAVQLADTRISGGLDLSGAKLSNPGGPALNAAGMRVGGLRLDLVPSVSEGNEDPTASAAARCSVVTLDLPGVQVDGWLWVDPAMVGDSSDTCVEWIVDGLTYTGLPRRTGGRDTLINEWLEMLQAGTPMYAAQPYRQLASALAAAGHDKDARRVLIAQREDQVKRGETRRRWRWPGWAWTWCTGFFLGYGYKPWRALYGLVGCVAVALLLVFVIPGPSALTLVVDTASADAGSNASAACDGVIERVDTALGYSLPRIIWFGTDTGCVASSDLGGDVLRWAQVILTLLGWVFASLFVASFTSAIRKT